MDTAPWVWIVVAIVVVALIVLLIFSGGRRRRAMQEKRDQEHREKAAEIRREAENMELEAREREAKAIRARADAEQAQVDAARLRQEAEARSKEAQSLRSDVAGHARKADELDPDVGPDGTRSGVREAGEDRPAAVAGRDGYGPGEVREGQSARHGSPARDDAAGPVRESGESAADGHDDAGLRRAHRSDAPVDAGAANAGDPADASRNAHDERNPGAGI